MATTGLRELKKARTRRLIADTAARLFAERGYEHVAVTDVAREAEVAEQTVYNYFPVKEQLVTDREQRIQDRLSDLIRSRPPAVTPAAAIRDFVLESVDAIRGIAPEMWRGELGYLAAISPAVHRLALELTDRQAVALASAISDTTTVAAGGRQAAGDRAGRRVPDHHQRGRPAHPRRTEPAGDRQRAASDRREHPGRARPLAQRLAKGWASASATTAEPG